MNSKCPKCGGSVSADAAYCEHCGHWLRPYARSSYVQTAGTLLAGSTIGFLIIFILSVNALLSVFEWYPQFVAQQWFVYDQAVTAIAFLGLVFGFLSTVFVFLR